MESEGTCIPPSDKEAPPRPSPVRGMQENPLSLPETAVFLIPGDRGMLSSVPASRLESPVSVSTTSGIQPLDEGDGL